MDLFAITCTTCKTRLRVRDQAAIGQILACPKCGGMVMVKPPPNWSEGQQAKLDEPTVTEAIPAGSRGDQTLASSAFDAVEELLSDSPPKIGVPVTGIPPRASPVPTAPPAPARPRFLDGPPAARSSPPPTVKATPTLPPPVATVAVAGSPTAAHAATDEKLRSAPANDDNNLARPVSVETSAGQPLAGGPANPPWRYWALMGGSVTIGIVLALAAVTAAIHLSSAGPATTAKTDKDPATSGAPSRNDPGGARQVAGAALPKAEPTPHVARAADQGPADSSISTPAGPTTSPSAQAASSDQRVPPAQADPLGLVKEPETPSIAPSNFNDPLAKFDRLIGGGNDDPLAKSSQRPPESPVPAGPPDATPARPVVPRPPTREIDLTKRLADPLPSIETAGTKLADFLLVISDLSTIPISLEPDALALVKATADTPVVLKAVNTNVGGALTEALQPLKLEFVVIDDQLIVRLAEPNPLSTISVPAKDLAGDEQQLGELAELLKSVIEAGSWGEGEEVGSIAVDGAKNLLLVRHQRAVQAQCLLACEKLRFARGKPNVLKLDPALFKLDTRWARAKARLETPVSLNYSQPTRLVTILDRLGASADVRILVDWRDVAVAGWNPDGEATLVADKQPLAAALDALLGPMDLSWRVVDGQTLQVVTPARLADRVELEYYKVEGLTAGDPTAAALLTKVRESLGPATFREGGGIGEVRFDAEGKCLLASLPQLKQRELETLLETWQSEAGGK